MIRNFYSAIISNILVLRIATNAEKDKWKLFNQYSPHAIRDLQKLSSFHVEMKWNEISVVKTKLSFENIIKDIIALDNKAMLFVPWTSCALPIEKRTEQNTIEKSFAQIQIQSNG